MKINDRLTLFLGMSFFLLTACHSGQEKNAVVPDNAISTDVVKNPATASSDSSHEVSSTPVFQFTDELHDFGTIVQGEKISYAFRFKNTGGGGVTRGR